MIILSDSAIETLHTLGTAPFDLNGGEPIAAYVDATGST
jgi:hypothetical protein